MAEIPTETPKLIKVFHAHLPHIQKGSVWQLTILNGH